MRAVVFVFFASFLGCSGGRTYQPIDLGAPPNDLATPVDLRTPPFDPDASCAVSTQTADLTRLPVDIIFVVDNSGSMSPAVTAVQTGLNDFSTKIDASGLDYHIVLLSLRSATNPVTVNGKNRYGFCIAPPLAGGSNCDDGPRFVHSSADILSVQPLEQFLGNLGQTAGYTSTDSRGGDKNWRPFLRDNATKSIVVISDDNSRITQTQFETFAGGSNPYNTTTLPPGILDASWSGLFANYMFSAIYGWGSATDPTVSCTYSGGTMPASPGANYTTLVANTGGVRAKICDDPTTWGTFFDDVSNAVVGASKLACNVTIPTPTSGVIDPGLVNVTLDGAGGSTTFGKVIGSTACAAGGGWYYDNDTNPTQVILCDASCNLANASVKADPATALNVHFGCTTIVQ
jgi:hypothetical protein